MHHNCDSSFLKKQATVPFCFFGIESDGKKKNLNNHNHPLQCTTGLQSRLKLKGKQYRWYNANLYIHNPRYKIPFSNPSFTSHESPEWMLISCHLWWDDLIVKSNYSSGKEITWNMQIPSPLLWQGTLRGNSSIIPTDGIYGWFFSLSPPQDVAKGLVLRSLYCETNFPNFFTNMHLPKRCCEGSCN